MQSIFLMNSIARIIAFLAGDDHYLKGWAFMPDYFSFLGSYFVSSDRIVLGTFGRFQERFPIS
jgi:hypothetical protein